MDILKAYEILNNLDKEKKFIYRKSDLRILFNKESERSFNDTLQRLIDKNILNRAANGVFVFNNSKNIKSDILEKIAANIRRGFYNYVSLESALSEYGVISQIPAGTLTIMTTGRKGKFSTEWGNIEFIHTNKKPQDIIKMSDYCGNHYLRFANPETALKDLKSVNRNLHLVSLSDYQEICNECEQAQIKL
jgi:hypothetical protein